MLHEDDDAFARPSLNGSGALPEPPSRLPELLRRLGLDRNPQDRPEMSSLLADLKDPAWYKRAAALQELAKRGEQVPLEALLSALEDEHVSVRANAVQALAQLGTRAPLERLSELLLHDDEWQVRESAAFALAGLGEHTPLTPLLSALYDPDATVRQAVRHVLEQTHPELLDASSAPSQESAATRANHHLPAEPFKGALAGAASANEQKTHLFMHEKEEAMPENNFSTETIAYTNDKKPQLEPRQPKRRLWRVVSLSVAAAVVIINLLAWAILTHTLHNPGSGTGSHGAPVPTPAATVTPTPPGQLPTPGQSGQIGKTLFVYPPAGQTANDDFMSVGWSADGKYISLSEFGVTLFNASTGKIAKTLDGDSGSSWASWSPDGHRLAISSGTVRIVDVQTGKTLVTYTPKGAPAAERASAGSALIALSGGNMVYDSAWSVDGKLIASAVNGNGYGYNVQVWNATTGAWVHTFNLKASVTSDDYITSVAWSADGKYLAANSPNDGIFVWNVASGQLVYKHAGGSQRAIWSPKGDVLASSSGANGEVQVWDAITGATLFSFQGQQNGPVSSLAWSPDGKYLAAGGSNVRIWDVARNKLHYTYTGFGLHKNFSINSLAWSPDSTKLVAMGVGMDITAPGTGIPLDSIRVWVAA